MTIKPIVFNHDIRNLNTIKQRKTKEEIDYEKGINSLKHKRAFKDDKPELIRNNSSYSFDDELQLAKASSRSRNRNISNTEYNWAANSDSIAKTMKYNTNSKDIFYNQINLTTKKKQLMKLKARKNQNRLLIILFHLLQTEVTL